MEYRVRLTGFHLAEDGELPEEFVSYISVTDGGNLFPSVWEEGVSAKEFAPEGAFSDGMGGYAAISNYILAWKNLADEAGIEVVQIENGTEKILKGGGADSTKAGTKEEITGMDYEVCFEGFHEVNEETVKELEGYTPYLCICRDGELLLGFWEDWYDAGKGGFFDGMGGHFAPDPEFIVAWKSLMDDTGIRIRKTMSGRME